MLKNVDGAAYRPRLQLQAAARHRAVPSSTTADVDKGKACRIRRRHDYWAEKHRRNVGTGNFDEIREIVVRDQNLAFEMFKKGDLDYYFVNISRRVGRGAELRPASSAA